MIAVAPNYQVSKEAGPCSRSCSARIGCSPRTYAAMRFLIFKLEKHSSLFESCVIIQTIRSTEINRVLYLDVTIKDSDLFLRWACATGPSYAVPMGRCVKALGTSDLSEKLK